MKTKAVSITMPIDMYKQAEATARVESRTFSELIREALRRYAIVKEFKQLQAYGIKQTRKLGIKPKDVQRLIEEVRQGR